MRLLRLLLRAIFPPPKTARKIHFEPVPVSERLARRSQQTYRQGPEIRLVEPREISGRGGVIDGDTIDIAGARIRLAGIDAPELDHPFGQAAKFALVRLCKGNVVKAVTEGDLSHDRLVATCYLPDGRDLSAEMVKAGHAIDWPKFSRGKYSSLEPHGIRKKLWRCDARQKGRAPVSLPD